MGRERVRWQWKGAGVGRKRGWGSQELWRMMKGTKWTLNRSREGGRKKAVKKRYRESEGKNEVKYCSEVIGGKRNKHKEVWRT